MVCVVEEMEVTDRLSAHFGTTRAHFLQIALASLQAKNDSIPIDPKFAPGMLAYIYGVRAVRQVLGPKGFEPHSRANIESAFHEARRIKVMFQRADCAAQVWPEPKAISPIGEAKQALIENSSLFLFADMEAEHAEQQRERDLFDDAEAWYVIVAFDGQNASCELSRPKAVTDKQFDGFIERIFITGPDGLGPVLLDLADDTPPTEFKPTVSKKT